MCRPMPELPSILREGMSEVDYKVACDRLKPDLDNLTGKIPFPENGAMTELFASPFRLECQNHWVHGIRRPDR